MATFSAPDRPAGRGRRGLVVAAGAAGMVSAAAAYSLVAGSSRLLSHPTAGSSVPVTVLAPLLRRSVRLSGEDAGRPGVWGLRGDGGYVQVGRPVLTHGDGSVSRRLVFAAGAGLSGPVALERAAFPRTFELCREVFPGLERSASPVPYGELTRWSGPPAGGRAVVGVHGRGMSPSEMLRLWGPARRHGWGWCSVSFRGDGFSPDSPAPQLGWGEAEDLLWHLSALASEGVREVVLSGISYGGAVVVNLLARYGTPDTGVVRLSGVPGPLPVVSGLMLEAPALDWPRVVGSVVSGMRLPRSLAGPVVGLARLRSRLDVEAVSPLRRVDALLFGAFPLLLVHGGQDRVVPVSVSDEVARAVPSASYLRVPAGGHAQAFNLVPGRYRAAVGSWLAASGSVSP